MTDPRIQSFYPPLPADFPLSPEAQTLVSLIELDKQHGWMKDAKQFRAHLLVFALQSLGITATLAGNTCQLLQPRSQATRTASCYAVSVEGAVIDAQGNIGMRALENAFYEHAYATGERPLTALDRWVSQKIKLGSYKYVAGINPSRTQMQEMIDHLGVLLQAKALEDATPAPHDARAPRPRL